MFQGTIFFVSPKGWYLCERDGDSSSIFVHPKQVQDHRRLHIDDRIEFTVTGNPENGKTYASDVKYLGRTITRQISGNGGAL